MSNEAMESQCFGKGWDGLSDESCMECSAQVQCKDKFVNDTFWKFMSNPENKGKTWEELSEAFSVSVPSIQEAHNTMDAILKEQTKENEEVTEEAKVEDQKVEDQKVEPTTPVVEETKTEGPVRSRRGRKPSDLITCPACGGTGGTVDNYCFVCDGYGDVSAKKYEEMQKKEMKANKKAEKEAAKAAKKAAKAEKKEVVNKTDKTIDSGTPVVVKDNSVKPVKPSKSTVVSVANDSGDNVATWAKLPITVDDLVELDKHGCGVTINVQDAKVQVSVFMEVPINTFFNRG